MNNKKVAIIGGGIAGLTAAYRLIQKGFRVKLFESSDRLGGMAKAIDVEGVELEIFYHHFFSTDDNLFKICREIGIYNKIRWLKAKMGYLSLGKVYDFGTPLSLLSFEPLTLREKIRFGLLVLKIKREKSLEKMDQCTAEDWLIKNGGKKVYDVLWKPLLIQKFGDAYKQVPMAWIWRKVHIRGLSKKNIFGEERLAYLDGSLQVLINKLKEIIIRSGGEIALAQKVIQIDARNKEEYTVKTDSSSEKFDIVVSTVAPEILNRLINFPDKFNDKLKELKQLGVICVLLITKEPLTKYYWLNIGDNSLPFGLVVEHTNFCSSEEYNGKHIVYLSKYFGVSDDILSRFSEEEIKDYFLKYLSIINKDFKMEGIEKVHIFREQFAQPIVGVNYSNKRLGYATTLPNFYWISTNHIYPDDRGVNYSIKIAEELVENLAA